MPILDSLFMKLAVALGIGLLVGAERERRKGRGPSRSPAGIRTFAVMSLTGAISFAIGGEILLAVTTAGAIILTAVAYCGDDGGASYTRNLPQTALRGVKAASDCAATSRRNSKGISTALHIRVFQHNLLGAD